MYNNSGLFFRLIIQRLGYIGDAPMTMASIQVHPGKEPRRPKSGGNTKVRREAREGVVIWEEELGAD